MSEEKWIRRLIDGYCSGSLSNAEFEELEDALRARPELRRELIEARALESDLRDHLSGVRGFVGELPNPSGNSLMLRRGRREVFALAAGIAILLGGTSVFLFLGYGEGARVEVDPGVAVLTRTIDAEWSGNSFRDGESLAPGNLRLAEGTVELEFYSGASVILEAPAELELVSESRGKLIEGRLSAEVPPQARGFTISTPEIELVDLGTSFGMEVNPNGGTGVHVFDGEVELFRPDRNEGIGKGESLLAGDGREIDVGGSFTEISADQTRFLSRDGFNELASRREAKKLNRWGDFSSSLKGQDRLLAYFDFQPESGSARILANQAMGATPGTFGTVIGATWEEGRWPGKGALDFKRPSDRVRIEIPGKVESLTLVAWIRIDGLDHRFSSLLLSDGWGRSGAVHWQIRSDSIIALSVSHGDRSGKLTVEAPFPMNPSDFGRWMQVAVVYDSTGGEVVHYRDGKEILRLAGETMVPLQLGSAEIGNWRPPARRPREVRNFNGRIDELMIYDRALTEKQVSALFLRGAP